MRRPPRKRPDSYVGRTPASENASRAARGASKKSDTKPELLLRRALWAAGLRYRKNAASLPGKPDVVFLGAKLAVFCDGDFWHGRNWSARREKLSKGHNAEYWLAKIERNMRRDADVTAALRDAGWTVLRVWETDVKRNVDGVVQAVRDALAPTTGRDGLGSRGMADLPPISVYMEPLLHVLVERGGRATNEELNEGVAARLGLSEEQQRVPHGKGDGRSELAYRMAWARTRLKKAGALEPDGRKVWRITDAGRARIAATPLEP